MQSVCEQCHHAQYLHDVWGICGVLGCKPCHMESECPRCKHLFGNHTVSDSIVFCAAKRCDYVTCFSKASPDKPLMRVSALPARPPVTPLPPASTQVTYEDSLSNMLPAIYRHLKTAVEGPAPTPLPIVHIDPVEEGYV
jgi:hypothetical protein